MPIFQAGVSAATKHDSATVALAKWKQHKKDGTFPTFLEGTKEPTPQFSNMGREDDSTKAAIDGLGEEYRRFRVGYLDAAITAKEKDVAILAGAMSQLKVTTAAYEKAKSLYEDFVSKYVKASVNSDGVLTFSENPVFKTEFDHLVEDLGVIYARALQITLAHLSSTRKANERAPLVKKAADVEMASGDGLSSASLSKMVDDRVSKALEGRLGKSNAAASSSTGAARSRGSQVRNRKYLGRPPRVLTDYFMVFDHDNFDLVEDDETSAWSLFKAACARQGYDDAYGEVASRWTASERRQVRRWTIKAEMVCRVLPWEFDHPSTYPHLLLCLPLQIAVRVLLSRVPLVQLQAARYRSLVHVGPNVYFPLDLHIHVSSGLRFMFERKINPSLVRSAYHEFARSLSWRAYFESKPKIDEHEEYDPDYEVKSKNKTEFYEKLPPYFINGLDAGRRYIETFIESYDKTRSTETSLNGMVQVKAVEQYIKKHGLLVTATDKNLGAAIVRVEWLVNGCKSIIDNPFDYEKLDAEQTTYILQRTIDNVNKLARLPAFENRVKLAKFLRSKIPSKNEMTDLVDPNDAVLPNFWGLPKIHKSPWAVRPIVPCHSNMQSPAAKFVSKTLKPVVNAKRFVLKGTKALANNLALLNRIKDVRLKPEEGEQIWIVTGDVVAMYPNIPMMKACAIATTAYRHHTDSQGNKPTPQEVDALWQALLVANRDLVMKFQDQTYVQKRGLAMGVACSPNVANLYAAQFEEELASEFLPFIKFYTRYIDDVFMIVSAKTREDVLDKLNFFVLGELEMKWNIHGHEGTEFLDMHIYFDPLTGSIEHKPFQKKNNHLERIPWISSHPRDVLRGAYISEMSRLATLNSTRLGYESSICTLRLLYVGRGYPAKVVEHWAKDQLERRWNRRLEEPIERERGVLVLKTEFNAIWDKFDSHELMNVIGEEWETGHAKVPWCNEPSCERVDHSGEGNRLVRENALARVQREISLLQSFVGDPNPSQEVTTNGSSDLTARLSRCLTEETRLSVRVECSKDTTTVGAASQSVALRPDPRSEDSLGPVLYSMGSSTPVLVPAPTSRPMILIREPIFDLHKSSFLNNELLVSRKRTTQLSDLLSIWRKQVLNDYRERTIDVDNGNLVIEESLF